MTDPAAAAGPARLSVRALTKTFGSARVLTDVELTVRPGEVHGLAGQNGSGKSTLIKIVTGLYTPDPGAGFEVDGQPVRLPVRWPEVHAAGLSVVHQDLGLLDQLTVAENICIGGYPTTRLGRIDRGRRDQLAAQTLDRLGVPLAPGRLVGTLTAAQRAEVAIARAMRDHTPGSGLIILDESTRALSGADLDHIHQVLRRIAADGSSALMVSHSLPELIAVADRITVLRDGKVAGAGLPTAGLSEQDLARRMLGSTVEAVAPRGDRPGDSAPAAEAPTPAVTVTGLTGPQLAEVSFTVAPGEILGVTGLPGGGYEQIPYLLTGARPATGGQLATRAGKVALARGSVAACLRAGVVLVPERRDRDGLAFELNVRDNISLPKLTRRGRPWFVARRWQHEDADAAVKTLDIRPSTPSILVKQLSGGNQQKVLLAKWLNAGPALLVLHEPTQAVDIGARTDILHALQRAANTGVAVLMVSSEPEDLVATCDRILVYGREVGLRPAAAATPEQLIEEIYATNEATAGSAT
ncbi:MAG TPA: sugar ABC transporter ATP-binding protein [Streptosporangiaceae bacterium]|nr:sugar ABC transporter ATP-binding protein [Streptosporangiaceae bacterium]